MALVASYGSFENAPDVVSEALENAIAERGAEDGMGERSAELMRIFHTIIADAFEILSSEGDEGENEHS